MSDFGLYASIYEQLRAYADRLDCSLVDLRSEDISVVSKAREKLASFLREVGSKDTLQPGSKLVTMVLTHELSRDVDELSKLFVSLAESLEKGRPHEDDLAKLEEIASAIDKECENAGLRMRGRL